MKPKDNTRCLALDLGDPTKKVDAKGRELCCICGTSTNPDHVCKRHEREFVAAKKQKFFEELHAYKPPAPEQQVTGRLF